MAQQLQLQRPVREPEQMTIGGNQAMKQIITTFVIGLSSLTAAWGQDHSPTVTQIVQRFVNANGGSERLHAVRSLQTRGTFELAGNAGPFTMTRLASGGYRVEVSMNGGSNITATDCTKAWRQEPSGSSQLLDERSAALLIEESCDLVGQLVDAEKKGHRVELVGEADVDGTPAYHLQVHLKGGHTQDWFISRETYLLIKKQVPGWSDWMGDHQVVTWYLDYQQHEGLMVPSMIERESNETFVQSFSVEEVKVNPEVDRSIFKAPETAANPD
jgi:hypothetical protein